MRGDPVGIPGDTGINTRIRCLGAAVAPANDAREIDDPRLDQYDWATAIPLARIGIGGGGAEHGVVSDLLSGVLAAAGVNENGGRFEPSA